MKSVTQIVLLLVALVGVVFGVTALTQFTRTNDPQQKTGIVADAPKTAVVDWYEKVAVWDPNDSTYVKETERGVKDHYDFLVSNPNDRPVTLTLNATSCKCTSVLFAVLPPAERDKVKGKKPPPAGEQIKPFVDGVQWQSILREKGVPAVPVNIPAADGSPQFAVIRLEWDAKQEQLNRLSADFNARLGQAIDYLRFEVPILIVPPVIIAPEQLAFGDIKSGDTREAVFYFWSATREKIDADVQLTMPDPCIVVAPPRPLSETELKELPATLAAGGFPHKTRPKCAYEVKINLAERRGDNQLELGPLARRINFKSGAESAFAVIAGTIRGPIVVGDKDDNDRINFRVFRADRQVDKTVEITSSEPNTTLIIDHFKPATLNVELKEIKGTFGTRKWNLNVLVPADTQAGPFPIDSAIYLKTNSNPPRRIRIPVVGNASG
jgi:hypothetical protein